MKKIIAAFFSIVLFSQSCFASTLYLFQNVSKNLVTEIIEDTYLKKSYVLTKKNPYYGVSKRNSSKYAIVLLQEDISGLYYYFDGEESVNKNILKQIRKKNVQYVEVNTRLKDSFDKIAAEQVFGKRTEYVFDTSSNKNTETSKITNEQEIKVRSTYKSENSQDLQGSPVIKSFREAQKIQEQYSENDTSFYQQSGDSSKLYYGYVGKLAAGTEIYGYLKNSLNTESIKKGDMVDLVVSRDLLYNNIVIAPQGSLITGAVVKANSAGYLKRNGKISIDFNTLILPDGKTYHISTEKVDFKIENNEKSTSTAVKIIAGAASSALVGLLFAALGDYSNVGKAVAIGAGVGTVGVAVSEGVKKGVDAEIPAYTEINLILTQPLNVRKN